MLLTMSKVHQHDNIEETFQTFNFIFHCIYERMYDTELHKFINEYEPIIENGIEK